MEEKTVETKTEVSEQKNEPATPKKDPFSMFGKIATIVIVAALLLGGGLYLGQTMNKDGDQNTSENTAPTQTITSPTVMQQSPEASPTDSEKTGEKTVYLGPAKGTSFKLVQIDIPAGWSEKRETTDITDKLIVTKGAYELSIYQAPMGGSMCVYPGDAEQMMSQKFSDFVAIQGGEFQLRRSWNKVGNPAGTIVYTVCQKNTDNFGSPTSYGAISIKTPDPSDAANMKDIDFMLSSLVTK